MRSVSAPYNSITLIIFFFQAEDGIRDKLVTGVQTCALPIFPTTRKRTNKVDLFRGTKRTPGFARCLERETSGTTEEGASGTSYRDNADCDFWVCLCFCSLGGFSPGFASAFLRSIGLRKVRPLCCYLPAANRVANRCGRFAARMRSCACFRL